MRWLGYVGKDVGEKVVSCNLVYSSYYFYFLFLFGNEGLCMEPNKYML